MRKGRSVLKPLVTCSPRHPLSTKLEPRQETADGKSMLLLCIKCVDLIFMRSMY